MQAMQRVVILFVGILSVVRATPFELGGVDRPTPFRYKGEFGNDAFSKDSKHVDDYEVRTFESDEHSNFIDESDEGKSMQAVIDLFGGVQFCTLAALADPPKEGCAYVANGDIYLIRILNTIDIEDVDVAFEDAGIEECEVGEEGLKNEPENGCFWINEHRESVYWIGVYDEDIFYEADEADEIRDAFDYIKKCDLTLDKISKEGCALYDEEGIHLINVFLNLDVDEFKRLVSRINISECIFDEEHGLTSEDPCFTVNYAIFGLHFLNLHRKSEDVHDNNDDDDSKASPPSVIETATGNGNLQQLKLNGLFNQRSLVAKKAKVVLPKEIQSRKQPQDVQQKLGRRDHQHGHHGSNGGKVNHWPKWMRYLQTNA